MAAIMKLNEEKLTKLQLLEKEIGCYLVAYELAPKPATISDVQLKKLQSLENELAAVIVAYKNK